MKENNDKRNIPTMKENNDKQNTPTMNDQENSNAILQTLKQAMEYNKTDIPSVACNLEMDQPSLEGFMDGKHGLQAGGLGKLIDSLGLTLARIYRDQSEIEIECQQAWEDYGEDDATEDYIDARNEAWKEYSSEVWSNHLDDQWKEYSDQAWDEFATGNNIDSNDGEGHAEWHAREHPNWLAEYNGDGERFAEWAAKEEQNWMPRFDAEWKRDAVNELTGERVIEAEGYEWITIMDSSSEH